MKKFILIFGLFLYVAQLMSGQAISGPSLQYSWTVINGTSTGQVGKYLSFSGTQSAIPSNYSLAWTVTGTTPTACTFSLQGSNDAQTWFNLDAGGVSCTASSIEFITARPVVSVRVNLATWTPGSITSVVTFNYVGSNANGGGGGGGGGASTPATNLLLKGNGSPNGVVAGTPQSIAATAIGTDTTSMFLSSLNPTTPGTNNFVMGVLAGSNIFTAGVGGSTWFGGNNVLLGTQAGKSLTSAADNVLIGYQAGQLLQGGSSTGCVASGGAEEDGIITAVGENAAAALNTPSTGACQMDSSFFGQKAGGQVFASYQDTYIGTHTGAGSFNVGTSFDSTVLGAWASVPTAATTTSNYDTFLGAQSGGGPGGTWAHDTGVGFSALSKLDGTVASTGDWNTAIGDSAGCAVSNGRYNTFLGGEAGGVFGNCGTFAITGSYNIGIGRQSVYTQGAGVSGSGNIVLATQATTNPVVTAGNNNVVIGTGPKLVGASSTIISIGNGNDIHSNGTEVDQILIGGSVQTLAGDHGDIAIGKNAFAKNSIAIAIGNSATANNNRCIAIGNSSSCSSDTDVAIGASAAASGVNSIELGAGTCASNSALCLYGVKALDSGGGHFATTYNTTTNCSSSAAPAVCAAAAAGSVVVAASATTVVVNTTAVTANSQIILQEDSSLGTKLSVTCNTTPATTAPTVSARTAATSFTITTTAPTTNPRCLSYYIVN